MTSPDLDLMSGLLLRLKGNFPIRIMGSNQSLDRMSIKLPLLESTAMGASLFCLFFDWGTLSSREKSTSQQAGRPRTHARTTFGFGSAMTAEIQFRDRPVE